ncbi:MAG: PrgH/EprH family type III secretion apparatus protein [Providencia sp.]|uniref:PrgH/EprH family type III secretion apparatus protein n=1 Tax=Providencia sp. TaxID=589 RepID=UPI003F9BD90B
MNDTNNRACIIKIASGPMNGQELMINTDMNLIIINKDIDYRTDINDEGFTTYYIPSDGSACEFSIITDENNPNEGIAIRLNDNGLSTDIPVILQQLLLADIFPIAIKMQDSTWDSPQNITITENSLLDFKPEEKQSKVQKTSFFNKQTMLVFFFTLLSLFVLFVTFQYIPAQTAENTQKKTKMLEQILQGNHDSIIVTQGIKNESLILVKTQRDSDWSMQQLVKAKYNEKFSIKIMSKFESEIEEKLIDTIPDILKIELNNPCQPIIRSISNNHLINDEKNIEKILSSYFNCKTKINLKTITFDELLKKAELGLTESNVQWRKITKDNKVIFIVKDSLNDKQTISLINFTNSFYKKWGGHHIQFSVSLVKNELVGKSFVTNANGYILLGNNHWFFNSTSF